MPPHSVAIVIHAGVQALDVAGPIDVFAEANGFVAAEDRYETLLVAADRAPLRASNGMQLLADRGFDEADGAYSILLVAGGPALPTAGPDAALNGWLASATPRAGLYGAICTAPSPWATPGCSTAARSRPIGRTRRAWRSSSRGRRWNTTASTSATGGW